MVDPDGGPWLFGYGLTDHRSLRAKEPVRIGPLRKVNFLVGRNNHGKSTVLNAAALWTKERQENRPMAASTLLPYDAREMTLTIRRHDVGRLEEFRAREAIVDIDPKRLGVWVPGVIRPAEGGSLRDRHIQAAVRDVVSVPNLGSAARFVPAPNKVVHIPAFRELRPFDDQRRPTLEEINNHGRKRARLEMGEGLVAELGRWQSPTQPGSLAYSEDRARWIRLTEFMRNVLEDPEADLEIANNQEDLHIKLSQAGQMLSIDDLGDGIKQVLMIAAACILFDNHLVLLEEPEIHLHAGLQRKLMRFLAEKTENQYLIATHSAHVLDLPGAQIFHVTHDGTSTRVAPAVQASEVQQICQDLGYMASDLLQANYTIWVEGPSDRIYWSKWISLVDPDLIEGVHYTVMSYGGYLIHETHLLQADDESVEGLVHLLRLGRSCSVIADSDKTSEGADLPAGLTRLQKESEKAGSGHLLVCDWARTVENLVPRELFRSTIITLHPTAGIRLAGPEKHTPFKKPFDGMGSSTYSKVTVARRVAEQMTVSHMDAQLLGAARDLAGRIRRANGLLGIGTV